MKLAPTFDQQAQASRLGRFATVLLLAITAAGLPGCGDGADPTAPGGPAPGEPAPPPAAPDLRFEPSALDLAPGDSVSTTVRVEPAADLRGATFVLDGTPPGLSTRFEAAADGASGTLTLLASPDLGALAESVMVTGRKGDGRRTWVGSLKLTTSSTTARTFFVDPVTGNDANQGTQAKPFKTLTKALSKARAGDTVKLAGGGYGPTATSGEQLPASGLIVAAGVTIEGALDSGFPASTLVGTGGGVGLNFAGDATVRNLFIGGSGFGVGLFAKQGKQTLSNVFLGTLGQSAVVDGITMTGGIVLRGTAQATLLAGASGANTTGSTIFLNGNSGVGVSVNEQALFTMDGGAITAGDQPNCRKVVGVTLGQSAQATLRNIISIRNIAGIALSLRDASKATLSQSLVTRKLSAGCQPATSVSLLGSASLIVDRSNINQRTDGFGAQPGLGIEMRSSAPLTLVSSGINGFATGIAMLADGSLSMDGAGISDCHLCIDGRSAGGSITITNSFLAGGLSDSKGIITPTLKMRKSDVSSNQTGIVISGLGVDLGTLSDPGNNTLANDVTTAVTFDVVSPSISTLNAVGNTWNPNTQGADAFGHYTQHILVTQESALARGRNFTLLAGITFPNFRIQL
jgi:hypothetical protein